MRMGDGRHAATHFLCAAFSAALRALLEPELRLQYSSSCVRMHCLFCVMLPPINVTLANVNVPPFSIRFEEQPRQTYLIILRAVCAQ